MRDKFDKQYWKNWDDEKEVWNQEEKLEEELEEKLEEEWTGEEDEE